MTVYMYAYTVLLTDTCNMYEIKILLLLSNMMSILLKLGLSDYDVILRFGVLKYEYLIQNPLYL